ncbi:MAG: hypothetical protein ACQZ2J_01795 [Pseudomonas piscis]|uniref:hypothetical protein n=1 Tax=Pseudomonas piscis TaxID=2614538 RepID=UPI003D2902BA
MNPIFNHPEFSGLLLTITCALREVEIDDIADLFKASLLDRSLVEPAIEALRQRVHRSSPEGAVRQEYQDSVFAQETTLRLLQRLDRSIQLNRICL